MKSLLKTRRFADIAEIQAETQAVLDIITKREFQRFQG
jgi:hypothetical protein